MRTNVKTSRSQSGIALLTTILLMLLMSSLLIGFVLMITSGQKLSGMNNDQSRAFYAAEAGMEKMTADIGSLFDTNYSPTGTQIAALQTTPPSISNISYVNYTGITGSGYTISFPTDSNGNPLATVTQIKSGNYQGMTALATPYTLNVTAHTGNGSEVKLQRTTQTVGIPMFQFGVFSDLDLSFFAGPVLNFGGRTHTNGNLFLASGSTLTLSDRVTAVKDVVRTFLSNGYPTTTGSYNGTVNVFNGSSTRALGYGEGSIVGMPGTAVTTSPVSWTTISTGSAYYAGNLRAASTGPGKPLQLGIVTLGSGTTQAIDVLRRPITGEAAGVTAERYFAQASFRVLLSDNPTDLTSLPCIDSTVAPFDLSSIAVPVASWPTTGAAATLKTNMTTNNTAGRNTPPVPLAASGGKVAATSYNNTTDVSGYWVPGPASVGANGTPIVRGFIKIEIQTSYAGTPCGTWKDVTLEVLGFGYAGRNINTYGSLNGNTTTAYGTTVNPGFSSTGVNPPLLALSNAQINPSSCQDVHPNAIVRLERVRDNPSTWSTTNGCGVTNSATPASQVYPTFPSDYWPNSLFDVREGTLRDVAPTGSVGTISYANMVPLGGVMNYIEIDANNLARYLTGALPGSGTQAYDSSIAPNDYSVYVSDRRGNYIATAPTTAWPPISPSGHETGEYGFEDFVNASNQYGCPNSTLDTGEDLDSLGSSVFFTYGQDPTQAAKTYAATYPTFSTLGGNGYYGAGSVAAVKTALVGTAATNALAPHPNCTVTSPAGIWPFNYVIHENEARENPNMFFRRAVKIVNGANIGSVMNTCPGAVLCGLTITSENPVYVFGDFNCPSGCTGGTYNDPHIATSIGGDAVTLLSNSWNDINSFLSPYAQTNRSATTSYYRTAIISGKGISFPQPTGYTVSQDFGTDGGLHNFLRYIENWGANGGQTLNYRGSLISLYYSRQAIGVFKCCTTVYSPPTRGYNFDTEFLTPTLLPPRTPLFRDVNTTGFTQLLLPTQ
jgi:hypothetical protein